MNNLADATPEEVRFAMSRSKECFGPFWKLPGKTRSTLLKKIAEKMGYKIIGYKLELFALKEACKKIK